LVAFEGRFQSAKLTMIGTESETKSQPAEKHEVITNMINIKM